MTRFRSSFVAAVRHRFVMIAIFCGALLIAGLFTLLPGRVMHAVIIIH
jgi:uncharacterized membrane protein